MATDENPRSRPIRRLIPVAALVILLVAVALPTLAAGPGAAPTNDEVNPQAEAEKSPGPGKGPKVKVAKEAITLSGRVSAATDEDGRRVYRLASGGTTYELDGGPSWFYGDDHPLEAHVGTNVTIVGAVAEGSSEVDVETVDGAALRAPGRPPWAGGWKRVGEGHPGWSQEKADRFEEKFGDCFPPGQCKRGEVGE